MTDDERVRTGDKTEKIGHMVNFYPDPKVICSRHLHTYYETMRTIVAQTNAQSKDILGRYVWCFFDREISFLTSRG